MGREVEPDFSDVDAKNYQLAYAIYVSYKKYFQSKFRHCLPPFPL